MGNKILEKAEEIRLNMDDNFHDNLMEAIFIEAGEITRKVVKSKNNDEPLHLDRKIDKWITSPVFGFPLMFLLLAVVFWLTIVGSNYPSSMLATLLVENGREFLKGISSSIGLPWWLDGVLIDGAYLATAWVVSVMLPPMAIFFPIFTLLEDFGYLPRVAFNLDNIFKRVGAHGKQALSMTMGFGCNAAGIIATRVIDSPRERLIAIITNNFSLCNGRWPTQILIASIFIGAAVPAKYAGIISAGAVVFIALLGIFLSFVVSWVLSNTALKGEASSFSLELPPYRPPKILATLYTSLIDRTIFVLWRAILFALPAGIVIWLVGNVKIDDISLANHFINFINPSALYFGLNGVIILAFIIAIPANEIVIPTILMLTVANLGMANINGDGVMFELDSLAQTGEILRAGGWTLLTAVNLMLFSLLHNPCSTTIYTIYKETNSIKWTAVATLLPIALGLATCLITATLYHLIF